MANNKKLKLAKEIKNDEFYTEYQTISNEMGHYRDKFKNKVIYCNCDDPSWSNFWIYFHSNFASLGLKKLISTHYQKDSEPSFKIEYSGGDDFNIDAGKVSEINGNTVIKDKNEIYYSAGDFRSNDCIKLLEEADIVVTNPPFSLFGEYLAQLIKYKKKFIIIGNQNQASYKEIFPLFCENKVWYGASIHSGGVDFRIPDTFQSYSSNVFVKNGHHYINLAGVRWYTNIDVTYRHDGLWHKNGKFDNTQAHVYYEGNEDKYPKYFNFDGIDVNETEKIPIDYDGAMGVPINFLDKFNPDEFEILGSGSKIKKIYTHKVLESKKTIGYVNGKGEVVWSTPYTVKERKLGNILRKTNSDGLPADAPFSRIVIRNKNPIKKDDDKGY